MWLALCLVNLSVNDKPGNVYIQMLNEPVKYDYSFKSKKFTHFQAVTLSDREKQILGLAAQGYSAIDIAAKICVDINTVKYHKRNFFKKLGVKNISEAIYYAAINNMI
jgi:DNA-binding CsgD family transcriptional regulator